MIRLRRYERRDPRDREAGRNADAQQPRAAFDHGVAVGALDAVRAGEDLRARDVARRASAAGRAACRCRRSASRLRARTRLFASVSVTTDPSGSGMPRNSVSSRSRLRASASTPSIAPAAAAHRIREHDRRPARHGAGHQLADDRLARADDLPHLGQRRHLADVARRERARLDVAFGVGEDDVDEQRLIAQHRREERIAIRRGRARSRPDGAPARTPSSRGRSGTDRDTRRRSPPATPACSRSSSTCSTRVRLADQAAAITNGTSSAHGDADDLAPDGLASEDAHAVSRDSSPGAAGRGRRLRRNPLARSTQLSQRAARAPVRRRVVAAVGQAVVEPELERRAG